MAEVRTHISGTRLDISRDNEILQSFVRINLDEDCEDQTEPSKPDQTAAVKPENTEKDESLTAEQNVGKIGQKQIQKEVNRKGLLKRRKRRITKHEELYTDKDRAAAVNMGTKDIKQSLKMKRQQDRSRALDIPEEADPASFLALGNYEMRKRDIQIAIDFINKALELNPSEKNALVARSKCYILLGQPENGLKDAEAALAIDKTCMKAIYQKAESLYYLGDFEHSLMYFHRGLHLRPDHEGFKLGVDKARKAIENAIGANAFSHTHTNVKSRSTSECRSKSATPNKLHSKTASMKSSQCTSPFVSKNMKQSRLLRELGVDKDYLDNLLNNPNIKCKHKDNDDTIKDYIQEAVEYLNKRQEFWRQQLPTKLKQ